MYLVSIITTDGVEFFTESKFVTKDLKLAANWVNKFNRIIIKNSDRLSKYEFTDDNLTPFWYDFINYDSPQAIYKKIEERYGGN